MGAARSLYVLSAILAAVVSGPDAWSAPEVAGRVVPEAESTEADRRSVAVTVTQVGLGLVREVRAVNLPAGASTLRLADVPTSLNPRSLVLGSSERGRAVKVERVDYAYDLFSPERLMERYVGREVELVEKAEDLTTRTTPAILLSMHGGPVYRVGDRILLFRQGEVLLPRPPADLAARPSLLVGVDSPQEGSREIELSYLTDGLGWSADYVAVVSADQKQADLQGWVSVDNRSGAAYRDATLKLVAGQLRRVTPPMTMQDAGNYEQKTMMRAEAAPAQFAEESFSEYHLYTLDRPADLENNRMTQLALFEAHAVPVVRRLVLTGQTHWYRGPQGGPIAENQPVAVILEIVNAEKAGLGIPIPSGIVRVYQKDRSGAPQITGEARIGHTPRDETMRLEIGEAFDVVADRTQTDYRASSPRQSESAYEVSIRNRKEEDVTVIVREPLGGDWKIVESSHPPRKADFRTAEFEVRVPAGQEVKLTYRVRVTW